MCSCATFINIYFKLIIFLKLFALASQYDVTVICLIGDCLQNSFARGYWNRCAVKVYTGGKTLHGKTKLKTPNWAKFCSRFTLPPAWLLCWEERSDSRFAHLRDWEPTWTHNFRHVPCKQFQTPKLFSLWKIWRGKKKPH